MTVEHYIGFDVHKKSVSYCIKAADGRIVEEGKLPARREVLRGWAQQRKASWSGAMEATLFSGWIYDTLKPFAAELQMGHPAMLKAIGASKKKNDRLDAQKTADLVRCNLLPACYVAPPEIRELRRMLRYRNLVVREAVRRKNKIGGLRMEVGEVKRLRSVKEAVSCCGLTSALIASADKQQGAPISKQRNGHLQRVLIEAAKLAPRWNAQLAAVHERELQRGNRNRATLAVARKLVAYLLAVDRSGKAFQARPAEPAPPAGKEEGSQAA